MQHGKWKREWKWPNSARVRERALVYHHPSIKMWNGWVQMRRCDRKFEEWAGQNEGLPWFSVSEFFWSAQFSSFWPQRLKWHSLLIQRDRNNPCGDKRNSKSMQVQKLQPSRVLLQSRQAIQSHLRCFLAQFISAGVMLIPFFFSGVFLEFQLLTFSYKRRKLCFLELLSYLLDGKLMKIILIGD